MSHLYEWSNATAETMSFPAIMKWLAALIVAEWLRIPGLMRVLIVLMCVDYGTGLVAAFIRHQLSSAAGVRGLLRKTLILVLLVTIHYIEKAASLDLHIDEFGALGYAINELISIVENCHKAGVPIPEQLVTALVSVHKMRGKRATDAQIAELDDTDKSPAVVTEATIKTVTHPNLQGQDGGVTTTTATVKTTELPGLPELPGLLSKDAASPAPSSPLTPPSSSTSA
jgi:toxin secretion/phage lysis holin